MVELSKRMQAVAAFVPKNTVVCDVGCDHGFVSIYLVQQKICPKVFAMDVKKGPLERAREHILQYGLEDYIPTRLSDGLSAIKMEEAEVFIDGAIIAGMGGRLVVKILEDSLDKVRNMSYLVLQPQSELAFVRKWLRQQGFLITDEDMVLEDGKYYPVLFIELQKDWKCLRQMQEKNQKELKIVAERENNQEEPVRQEAEDCYGPCLIQKKHPVLKSYLQFWEKHQQSILQQVSEHPERKAEILQELQRIHYTLSRMEH